MPSYRMYIDESGDTSNPSQGAPGRRYLGVVGVVFRQGSPINEFREKLEELKRSYFPYDPDDPPILHRKHLIAVRDGCSQFQDLAHRNAFGSELIKLIDGVPFKIIAVVVDKLGHKAKSYRSLSDPYHYCLLAILQRYCGWLRYSGTTGDLMLESRGAMEDRRLQQRFAIMRELGELYLPAEVLKATVPRNEILFKTKEANVAGLQLADVLAHPLTLDVLRRFAEQAREPGPFAADLLRTVTPKYNRRYDLNRIDGYGRVFLG